MHNHPSGNLEPSKQDTLVTDRILKLCDILGVPLIDHIIVGGKNESYFSFKEKDKLNYSCIRLEKDYNNLIFPTARVAENESIKTGIEDEKQEEQQELPQEQVTVRRRRGR